MLFCIQKLFTNRQLISMVIGVLNIQTAITTFNIFYVFLFMF